MMVDWSLSSFERPSWHAAIADVIRRRSTNRADVREIALDGLDLSSAAMILDLGCGFGFMTGAVAGRVAPQAQIVGVDACSANEQPYLELLAGTSRAGRSTRSLTGRTTVSI